MNIYTHSNRRAKRTSVEILDDLSTSIPSEIREISFKNIYFLSMNQVALFHAVKITRINS